MSSVPQQFAKLAFDSCQALKAQIEVTTRCNYRCGHCYNFDRQEPGAKGHPGLPTQSWKDIIQQIAELGVLELTFTGGEATLRSDLAELINFANTHSLFVNLRTNGALLSASQVNAYAAAGLRDLDITLYGFSPESHDKFTGSKGSFEKTLNNLESLVINQPQLRTFITIALLNHNRHETHLLKQLQTRLNRNIRVNIACNGRNDFELNSLNHALPLAEHVKLWPVEKHDIDKLTGPEAGDASTFRCGCARISLFINAEGIVTPCAEVPWEAGDLKTTSLREIWDHSKVFDQIRNLTAQDWQTCNGCALTKVCGRRNCTAYKLNGNYTDPDPQHGQLAYARFKDYGVDKPPCLVSSTETSES